MKCLDQHTKLVLTAPMGLAGDQFTETFFAWNYMKWPDLYRKLIFDNSNKGLSGPIN